MKGMSSRWLQDRLVIASGFGLRAQWLRNILKNPRVRVSIAGHRDTPATATPLDPEQAAIVLRRYAVAHPRAWQRLKPVFEQTLGAPINEAGTSLPMVRLTTDRPIGGRPPRA
jgi:deazaflavin-dependent oxidoreductase (nitroreductase family)